MKLDDLRKQIDGLDRQILEILRKRFAIAGKIAKIKKRLRLPIEDREREEKLMKNLTRKGGKLKLSPAFASQLFELIISESKRIQEE